MEDDANKLIDFFANWRRYAEQRAASPDASDDEKQDLADMAELLCGSAMEDVRLPEIAAIGSVKSLIEIVTDYEKLVLWTTRLRPEDRAKLGDLELGPFIPKGIVHLTGAMMAAFSIGGLAPKDSAIALQARRSFADVRDKRHPDAEETNAKLAALHAKGMKATEIAKVLGMEKGTAQKQIWRMVADGRIPKRNS